MNLNKSSWLSHPFNETIVGADLSCASPIYRPNVHSTMYPVNHHNEQVGWYEATLPLKERRSRGHFSTPPRLVERILDACSYTPGHDLTHIRVLDPACGSGNFLAEVARRLVSSAARSNLSPEELATLISRNIWGFDSDPVSCFLAEMQVRAIHCLPTDLHIHQADGLALPWSEEPSVDLFLANPPYLAAKNTDLSGYRSALLRGQADSYLLFLNLGLQIVRPHGWLGLVLPDPLLARTNAARERAHLLKDFTIHHLWHLANVFAAHVGAVVIIAQKSPPPATHHISWTREKWQKTTIANLADENLAQAPRNHVPQSLFLAQPGAEFRYLLSTVPGPTIERLRAHFDQAPASQRHLAPLSEFLTIRRGEELGTASPLLIHKNLAPLPGRAQGVAPTMDDQDQSPQSYQSKNLAPPPGRAQGIYLSPRQGAPTMDDVGQPAQSYHSRGTPCGCPGDGCPVCGPTGDYPGDGEQDSYPVLRGGRDIRPYATSYSGWRIACQAITKPIERYLSPKLLVVKSTDRLQAALDTRGHIALQTLYLLHPRAKDAGPDDLYFFLALLNSRLLQQYVHLLHTAYKWVQPQIEQHILARLPIPIVTSQEKQQVIDRAKLLAHACSEIDPVVEWGEALQSLYEDQELAISALYAAALPGQAF